jgi:hypothetical protein
LLITGNYPNPRFGGGQAICSGFVFWAANMTRIELWQAFFTALMLGCPVAFWGWVVGKRK